MPRFPDLKVADGKIYKRMDHLSGNIVTEKFAWKLWVPTELVAKYYQTPMSLRTNVMVVLQKPWIGFAKTCTGRR